MLTRRPPSLPLISSFLLVIPVWFLFTIPARGQTTLPKEEAESVRVFPEKPPDDPFLARLIPRNSKVYIAPFKSEDPVKSSAQGFESYIAAALRKKNVPLLIMANPEVADFIIEGTADKKGAGWAKKIFFGDLRASTSASITVTNLRTGVVAYADSSDKRSANRGLRSSAEKLAKYLKRKMEDDEKRHRATK